MREILQKASKAYEQKDYITSAKLSNKIQSKLDPHFCAEANPLFIDALGLYINSLTKLGGGYEQKCKEACFKFAFYVDEPVCLLKLAHSIKNPSLAMIMLKNAKKLIDKVPEGKKKEELFMKFYLRAAKIFSSYGNSAEALNYALKGKMLSEKLQIIDDELYFTLGQAYSLNANYQEAFKNYRLDFDSKNGKKDKNPALKMFDTIMRTIKADKKDENLKIAWALYERRFEELDAPASWMNMSKKTLADFENSSKNPEIFKDKSVIIFQRQGLGDTLMFLRYLDYFLALKPKSVMLQAPNSLRGIITKALEKTSVKIYNDEEIKIDNFDYFLPICSLPLFVGLNFIPKPFDFSAFLSPAKKQPKPQIGVFWKTTSHNEITHKNLDNGLKKSFALEDLLDSIFEATGECDCDIFSFQVDASDDEKALLKKRGICDLGSGFSDFKDSLNALGHLDLLITCDTSIAHLALSAGVRTAVILPRVFDWRWGGLKNPQSPWYPLAHLFACEHEGQWDSAFDKLGEFLKAFKL